MSRTTVFARCVALAILSCTASVHADPAIGPARSVPELSRTYFVLTADAGEALAPRPRSAAYGVHATLVPWISDSLLWIGFFANPTVGRAAAQAERTPRLSAGVRGGYAFLGLGAGPLYDLSSQRLEAHARLDLSLLLLRNYPAYVAGRGCCPPHSSAGERCACEYTPSGVIAGPFVSVASNFDERYQVVLGLSLGTGTAL